LWFKGETSGATQDLISISLDCDRDSLRFVVHQNGAGFLSLSLSFLWFFGFSFSFGFYFGFSLGFFFFGPSFVFVFILFGDKQGMIPSSFQRFLPSGYLHLLR